MRARARVSVRMKVRVRVRERERARARVRVVVRTHDLLYGLPVFCHPPQAHHTRDSKKAYNAQRA